LNIDKKKGCVQKRNGLVDGGVEGIKGPVRKQSQAKKVQRRKRNEIKWNR